VTSTIGWQLHHINQVETQWPVVEREFSPIFELVASLVVRRFLEHIFQSQYGEYSSTTLATSTTCLLNKLLNV
jgi:hypothetical protein